MVHALRRECLKSIIVCIVLLLSFHSVPNKTSAQEMLLFSFGKGKTQVRFYADYFCGPCSGLEPKIEYLVSDLVKRDIITIIFVDVPFHKHSSTYAKYFLYVLNEKKEIGRALKARAALFEGAKENIFEEEQLEAYLRKQGFRFKPFDAKPVFTVFQTYLREDNIHSTPTCVIADGKKKEVLNGADNIAKALESLK